MKLNGKTLERDMMERVWQMAESGSKPAVVKVGLYVHNALRELALGRPGDGESLRIVATSKLWVPIELDDEMRPDDWMIWTHEAVDTYGIEMLQAMMKAPSAKPVSKQEPFTQNVPKPCIHYSDCEPYAVGGFIPCSQRGCYRPE